jgi:hypothetical protein
MKKTILLLSAISLFAVSTQAQKKNAAKPAADKALPAAQAAPTPVAAQPQLGTTNNQNPDAAMKFNTDDHNFGTIPEGPSVSTDFEFTNIGKEPIVLSGVQASCGCTTPTWTKEPVMPGKKGKITATYSTQGRPGNFVKTITINSNVGTKVVKISGNVEKAPSSSVPADNGSIMKH